MRKVIILILLCFALNIRAQIGGTRTYAFLNLQPSARVAALGGNLISVVDDDVNLGYQNPSLLNRNMDGQLAFNYINYFNNINNGYVALAKHYDSIGTFSAGLMYVNYGKFDGRDATGAATGAFNAADYNFHVSYGRNVGKFSYGSTVKLIYSSYETYSSLGAALDLAGTYYDEEKRFTAAVVAKNLGTQFKAYTKGNREPLPFEIQAGISKKFEHNPLRFSIIAHNLQKPDLTYFNPNRKKEIDLETGLEKEEKFSLGDKIFRHLIFGGELVFSKNFNLRFGYNHQIRKEMTIEERRGLVGYSWGIGMKVNRFHLSYGSGAYFIGQSNNQFSIITNLSDFRKKNN